MKPEYSDRRGLRFTQFAQRSFRGRPLQTALAVLLLLYCWQGTVLAQASSDAAELDSLDPVTGEAGDGVEVDDPAVLREKAVADEEAAPEAVIQSLGDRCAALEAKGVPSAADDAKTPASPADTQLHPDPDLNKNKTDVQTPEGVESEGVEAEATAPEATAAEAVDAEAAEPAAIDDSLEDEPLRDEPPNNASLDDVPKKDPSDNDPPETDPTETDPTETDTTAQEEIDPETAARLAQEQRDICLLYRGDQLYQAGRKQEAIALYQTVKPPFQTQQTTPIQPPSEASAPQAISSSSPDHTTDHTIDRATEALTTEALTTEALSTEALSNGISAPPAPPVIPPAPPAAITQPEALPPAGQVYLREAAAGQAQNLETRVLIPLKLLTDTYPEYTPGHGQYAEALVAADQAETALAVMQRAATLHPDQADVIRSTVQLMASQGEFMAASMQARRFAQLQADHPEAETFAALAEENLQRYQGEVRDRLTANTIANVLTGAITYGVTGNIWNTLSTIQTTTLMLRGEEGVGKGISQSIQRQVPLVEDEEVLAYVNELGQKLAQVAGRDEFDYEFFVIMDETLNAFALPGGKVFVNAGAIAKTRSETELAGLLSHELAHSVLSHGFQLVSNGSLLSDISRFVPYAGYAANLVVLNYSRDMEREADELGTRILSAAGYPADGLHHLMKTLGNENTSRPLFAWMSTHPETEERVRNLETQIQTEGLDRYGLEGIERHDRIREKVKQLIEIAKQEAEEERKNRPWWR